MRILYFQSSIKALWHFVQLYIDLLVGFWPRVRACALRAPVFLGSLPRPTGAARPPAHRSFAAPPKTKNKLFPVTKCFPSGPNSGCKGLFKLFFILTLPPAREYRECQAFYPVNL